MNKKQRLLLKSQSHQLQPVVIIGAQGLTPAVQAEIAAALAAHELIKIRVNAETRAERQAITDEIIQHQAAELINQIGHVIAIYKQAPEE